MQNLRSTGKMGENVNMFVCTICRGIMVKDQPTITWIFSGTEIKWHTACSNTIMSCCGKGSSNNIRWNGNTSQWECKDCGAIKSNDPNYLYKSPSKDPDDWYSSAPAFIPATGPVCECGADKVYGKGNNMHSATMPCPLYRKIY